MSLESEVDLISANVTDDRTSKDLEVDLRALDRSEARARLVTDLRERGRSLEKIHDARNSVFRRMPAARERKAEQQLE